MVVSAESSEPTLPVAKGNKTEIMALGILCAGANAKPRTPPGELNLA